MGTFMGSGGTTGARNRSLASPRILAIGSVILGCVALNAALILWIGVGPPPGKGQSFFLELVLVAGAMVSMVVAAVLHPDRARSSVPVLFMILAWHTGFQISLSSQWPSVISAFDVLIPVLLVFGVMGRWQTDSGTRHIDPLLWKLFAVFGVFALWGLALGIARGTDTAAMIQNLKAFVLYPFIPLLMLWCIRTWRQLYIAAGAMLALIAERALDGIHTQGASVITSASDSGTYTLVAGRLISRANGGFAAVNEYALYLMSGVLVLVAIAVCVRTWRLRLLSSAVLVVMLYALTLTLTRGAFIAVGVGLVLLLVLLPRRQAVSIVLLALVAMGMVQVVHPGTLGLVTGRFSFVDNSTDERLNYLSLGEHVLASYPLGAGWGAAFTETVQGLEADHNPTTDWPWYHDDYLQLATETSVAGAFIFLWIWFVILRMGVKAARLPGDLLQRGITSGLVVAVVGMLFQAATDQVFWRSDIAPHVWIVVGLLMAAVALVRQAALASGSEDASEMSGFTVHDARAS